MESKQIVVNADNLIHTLENIWETLIIAANKTADLEQDLIKHGYSEPLTPVELNELLEKSAKENIRSAIQVVLECRKAALDKPNINSFLQSEQFDSMKESLISQLEDAYLIDIKMEPSKVTETAERLINAFVLQIFGKVLGK